MTAQELAKQIQNLADKHGYSLVVVAMLQTGPLTLDITRNLTESGVTLQWGVAKNKDRQQVTGDNAGE